MVQVSHPDFWITIYVMKAVRWIVFGALMSTVLACGGLGEPGTAFTVAPKTATVALGGTVKITMIVLNADVVSYRYSVEGGNANGTVVGEFGDYARATYKAPQTPGVYTVRAEFTQFGGETHSDTVTITVQ